jgi:uncharacterized protein (TIGR01777 family)
MRVAVAGGTGFLGSRLVQRLLDRGDEVVVFTRRPEKGTRTFPPPVRLARWNALDGPPAPTDLAGTDAVVNLLGVPVAGIWTRSRRELMRASRVRGTRHLVEGLRTASVPPSVLLSSSAVGIYGSRGGEVLAEDADPGTGYLADLAVDWEAEARAAEALGTRVILLRTALPLAPGGGLLGVLVPATRWGGGAVLGDGTQWMSWLHIEDWLGLVLFLLDTSTATGAFNATGPRPVTQAEFARTLAQVLGRPAPWRVPAALLRFALREAADETVLASQRAVPAKALGLEFRFRFPELEPALRDLLP